MTDKTSDETPQQAAAKQHEARKTSFEAEQKSREEQFEREQAAAENKAVRDDAAATAKAEADEKLRVAQEENDELAFEDGLLTKEDVVNRRALLAQHSDCQLPHQCLQDDEGTVKMVFPRNVILTLSASDLDRPIHHGSKVLFYKGYCDVPVSLADHQYLRDCGAARTDDRGKFETDEARAARVKAAQPKTDKAKA